MHAAGVLITAALREALGFSPMDGATVKGVDSAGMTLRQRVALPPLWLGSTRVPLRDAYVTTLKTDHDIDVGERRHGVAWARHGVRGEHGARHAAVWPHVLMHACMDAWMYDVRGLAAD